MNKRYRLMTTEQPRRHHVYDGYSGLYIVTSTNRSAALKVVEAFNATEETVRPMEGMERFNGLHHGQGVYGVWDTYLSEFAAMNMGCSDDAMDLAYYMNQEYSDNRG